MTYVKFEQKRDTTPANAGDKALLTPEGKAQSEPPVGATVPGAQVEVTKMKVVAFPSPASTVDSMRDEEKEMHLQLFRFNRAELSQILEKQIKEWLKIKMPELVTKTNEDMLLDKACGLCDSVAVAPVGQATMITGKTVTTKQIYERILSQYDEVFEDHRINCKAKDFACDDTFREKTSQMLDSKRWCEHKLALWLQNCECGGQGDISLGIYFYPLQQSFKMWLTTLRREIEELRCRKAELKQASRDQGADEAIKIQSDLEKRCVDLLKAKGRIPSSGIEDTDKKKEMLTFVTFLGNASVDGWGEEDLLALLDVGQDVEKLVILPDPNLSTTCLHLAAAHGNSFFLSTLFSHLCGKLQKETLPVELVHNEGEKGKGESPLYLAAENGHSSCLDVLLKFCPELPEFALSPLSAAVSRSHASCVKILLKNAPMLIHNSSNGFTPLMRAVSRGDIHIVKLLLWAGADVEGHGELSYLSTDDGAQSETVTVQQMMKLRCKLEDKQKSDSLDDIFKRRTDCKDLSAFREQFPNLIPGLI